uniref:Mucin 1, cell surface associated n=1 Tax=Sus scrofa TaxID=9823 RepID=A0A8D0Q2U0_PIG
MSSPTTSPASGLVTTPVHVGTSTPATSPASSSTVTPTHMGTSSKATMSPVSKVAHFSLTRPGSVLVELILAFQDSAAAHNLKTQFDRLKAEAGTYNLTISEVSVIDAPFPSSAQPGSGVPGWGIALLVLVCILVALAIIYVIALAVCQCRRKNCGQLDIFPTRDAYHPMSEYPTYHTHGRYVPPGSTKRNPYEQVSAGNGGGSLSYSNLAATSANL